MNNITQFSDCYGCGMCAIVCPKQIISIQQNINGFYEPVINNDNECIHCGQCLKVCSYADEQLAKTMMYWQVMLPGVKILLYEKNARPAA